MPKKLYKHIHIREKEKGKEKTNEAKKNAFLVPIGEIKFAASVFRLQSKMGLPKIFGKIKKAKKSIDFIKSFLKFVN